MAKYSRMVLLRTCKDIRGCNQVKVLGNKKKRYQRNGQRIRAEEIKEYLC